MQSLWRPVGVRPNLQYSQSLPRHHRVALDTTLKLGHAHREANSVGGSRSDFHEWGAGLSLHGAAKGKEVAEQSTGGGWKRVHDDVFIQEPTRPVRPRQDTFQHSRPLPSVVDSAMQLAKLNEIHRKHSVENYIPKAVFHQHVRDSSLQMVNMRNAHKKDLADNYVSKTEHLKHVQKSADQLADVQANHKKEIDDKFISKTDHTKLVGMELGKLQESHNKHIAAHYIPLAEHAKEVLQGSKQFAELLVSHNKDIKDNFVHRADHDAYVQELKDARLKEKHDLIDAHLEEKSKLVETHNELRKKTGDFAKRIQQRYRSGVYVHKNEMQSKLQAQNEAHQKNIADNYVPKRVVTDAVKQEGQSREKQEG